MLNEILKRKTFIHTISQYWASPGTCSSLKVTLTECGLATRGVKAAMYLWPPSGRTELATRVPLPPDTSSSNWPGPARLASTLKINKSNYFPIRLLRKNLYMYFLLAFNNYLCRCKSKRYYHKRQSLLHLTYKFNRLSYNSFIRRFYDYSFCTSIVIPLNWSVTNKTFIRKCN